MNPGFISAKSRSVNEPQSGSGCTLCEPPPPNVRLHSTMSM